jgi:hypothetical protein
MDYQDCRNLIRKHSVGVVEFIKKDGSNRRLIFNNELGKMYLNGGTYSAKHIDSLEPVFEVTASGEPVGWKSVSLDKIINLSV